MLVLAALLAMAMAAPSPVAGPNPGPNPNPQVFYSGYPVAYASPYVYYG